MTSSVERNSASPRIFSNQGKAIRKASIAILQLNEHTRPPLGFAASLVEELKQGESQTPRALLNQICLPIILQTNTIQFSINGAIAR